MGTVGLFHGTTVQAWRSIQRDGSLTAADHRGLAAAVEERFALPAGSVWNSEYNLFSRGFRAGDPKVYFSSHRQVAAEYALLGSEALFDALKAAWVVLHAEQIAAADGAWTGAGPLPWVREQTRLWHRPVLLELAVPWQQVAAAVNRSGRPLTRQEFDEYAVDGWSTVALPAPVPIDWVIAATEIAVTASST